MTPRRKKPLRKAHTSKTASMPSREVKPQKRPTPEEIHRAMNDPVALRRVAERYFDGLIEDELAKS